MVTSLIRPSWNSGFARNASQCDPSARNRWDGKVGHWVPSLGVSGISTLYDVSGYGNHGTMNGSMTIDDWVIGKNGYALDFDGTDDYANFGTPSCVADTKGSISLWFYLDATTPNDTMFGAGSDAVAGNPPYFSMEIVSGQYFSLSTFDGGVQANHVVTDDALSLDTWYHVVLTSDGSTWIVYINGVEVPITATIGTNNGEWIGDLGLPGVDVSAGSVRYDGIYINHWDGLVDDIRIYNRALNPSEIIQLYRDPLADLRLDRNIYGRVPAVAGGRIMSSLVNAGGLAGYGGIAGRGGGLAG